MEFKVVVYPAFSERENTLKQLVSELIEKGTSVQIVHASTRNAARLAAAIGLPVISAFEARFMPLTSDAIVLVDGDLLQAKIASRLLSLGKELHVLVPQDAIPPVGPGSVLSSMLENSEIVPRLTDEEDLPRTGGCHHFARTCGNCEGLVSSYLADRRDAEALDKD